MFKLTSFMLSLVFLSSCARIDGSTPYRSISSIESQLGVISIEEIQAEMRERFQRIEYTTLAAYEGMAQFDQHLDASPGNLEENPHYPGLLAARAQIEELEEEVIDLRDQFYRAALNPQLPAEERLKSVELVRATIPGADTAQDRLIYQHMHLEFALFTRQMLLDLAKLDDEAIRRAMEKLYAELNMSFGPMKEKDAFDLDWKSITSKARERLKDKQEWLLFRRDYEHRAQEVRADITALSRQKQVSPRFYPSADKAGNIVGTEFPAKVWSLTYDDGPGAHTTMKVLANLAKHELKATFFQLTKNAKGLSAVSKLVREAEMELASHSYSHRQTPKLSLDQRDYEIRTAASDLSALHSRPIKFYRLPYGAGVSNSDIRTRIAKAGMIHVFWSVDTLDWMAQAPSEIVARTKKQMSASSKDAGVILFHDIHERTVIASEEIMRYLKQDNRRVCTLEVIVEAVNRGAEPCAP